MVVWVRRSVVVVVIALMAVTTARRVQVWGSERLLWLEAVAHSPDKPRPWNNLGREYVSGRAELLAEEAFWEAARLADQPFRKHVEGPMRGRHTALLNLAILAANHKQYAKALALTSEIQPRAATGSITNRLEATWRAAAGGRDLFSGF